MEQSLGPQTAWHLADDSFDFLGDFDLGSASLDLLSGLEPAAEAIFSDHQSNDAALQISSGGGSAASGPDIQATAPDSQQAKQKAKAKELNKVAQKRFRLKQKSKWEHLQEELAASTAAVQKLQTENQHLSSKNTMLEKVAVLHNTEQMRAPLPQQVATRPSQANALVHTTWNGKETMRCTVNHTNEVITIYQIARMAPQQISILWQDYVREMAICLAVGGQSMRWDTDSTSGRRLTQLHDELCALCSAKARLNLQGHRDFACSPLMPIAQDSEEPNWLELGHALKLSEGQLKNVFLLRRAYLQKHALIDSQQHDLQLQLADPQLGGDTRLHALTVSQAAHQMQENEVLLHEAFMQYMGLIFDGVLSVWQAALSVVSTFPHPPEVLTRLIDALAQEAGEPAAASFQAAARNQSALDLASDSWMSIQTHIYKAKMMPAPVPGATAVAV